MSLLVRPCLIHVIYLKQYFRKIKSKIHYIYKNIEQRETLYVIYFSVYEIMWNCYVMLLRCFTILEITTVQSLSFKG